MRAVEYLQCAYCGTKSNENGAPSSDTWPVLREKNGQCSTCGNPRQDTVHVFCCDTCRDKFIMVAGIRFPVMEVNPPDDAFNGGYVYFVQSLDMIKIGFSSNVSSRLGAIRSHCSHPVHLLAFVQGTQRDEREIHRLFETHRTHGEWFRACPEISAFVQKIQSESAHENR